MFRRSHFYFRSFDSHSNEHSWNVACVHLMHRDRKCNFDKQNFELHSNRLVKIVECNAVCRPNAKMFTNLFAVGMDNGFYGCYMTFYGGSCECQHSIELLNMKLKKAIKKGRNKQTWRHKSSISDRCSCIWNAQILSHTSKASVRMHRPNNTFHAALFYEHFFCKLPILLLRISRSFLRLEDFLLRKIPLHLPIMKWLPQIWWLILLHQFHIFHHISIIIIFIVTCTSCLSRFTCSVQ